MPRNFCNLMKIRDFIRPEFLPESWNNGMVEYWSAWGGLKGMLSIFNYIVKTNFALTQNPIFPRPIIPLFQHSNWGEAPNL